jgi:hypothetical protein
MKKQIRSLCLVSAAVLSLHSPAHSQSVQDNCNAVTGAAVAGRDQANNRIRTIETTVQKQAEAMRSCMEKFSDAASRQALVLGGFDLAPLRNALMDRACNMIQSQVNSAQQAVTSQLPQAPSSVSQVFQTPGILPQSGNVSMPVGTTSKSIWDKISCSISGSC